MNSKKLNLYLIALLFPGYIKNELIKNKYYMAERYGSFEALRKIPHVTLKTPIELPAYQHKHFLNWFQSMPITTSAFQQAINGFGAFDNPEYPVIFAKPDNISRLKRLQREIIYYIQNSPFEIPLHRYDKSYTPHATVAYRDLTVPAFKQAWQEYRTKEYQAAFNVTGFHLLQHNRKFWEPISEHHLPLNNTLIEESRLSIPDKQPLYPTSKVLTLF